MTSAPVQFIQPVNKATENQSLVCSLSGTVPIASLRRADHADDSDGLQPTFPMENALEKLTDSRGRAVDETLIAGAIAGVVRAAQRRGQTIEELQAEMLADHQMLSLEERLLLSDIVTEAWERMAIAPAERS